MLVILKRYRILLWFNVEFRVFVIIINIRIDE